MSRICITRTMKLLHKMSEVGTLEQGQKKSILGAKSKLRRAIRTHDSKKILQAVNDVCKIFLQTSER